MVGDFSRRDMLKAGAAALAASTLSSGLNGLAGQTAAPTTGRLAPRRQIRKSFKFDMIAGNASILDKFKLAKEAGFDGVEMDSPNDLNADEILRARDESHLEIDGVVDSVHWKSTLSHSDPQVRAEGVKGLETALRDCKRYGGDTVLLVPAVVNKEVSYADAYARSQAEIRKVLPLAAELGVKIAIENVWNQFLLSPLEAARYIDEFQSPSIGWHFDVGNIVNYGWPEQWIRILGKRILKLDIKEFSRSKRDQQGLWKGFDVDLLAGDCDWPVVMKALDEIGFRGWAAIEMSGGDVARLQALSSALDRILAT